MILETFKITLKHDSGKFTVTLTSMSGQQGAIAQISACEGCANGAIIHIKKIRQEIVS
ncbi:hypothetical protein ACMGDK_09595 [Chryseobacterium sp. DT-3]|uniref:hypothetical protein n=1 Tax=Chryseobacterium sp. DT-3 TaxID=3396164 RepID=UPI003F1A94EB